MSALNFAHKSSKRFVCGASGTGKTALTLELIRNSPDEYLFVFDHQGEFGERLPSFACRTEADCLAAIKDRKAVVFDPSRLFAGRTPEGFEWFCRFVWAQSQRLEGVKLFVWDETGTIVPMNSGRYETHPIRMLAETGRTRRIDLLFTAQQPNHVNNSLRQQVTEVFVFRTPDETASTWFVQSKGFDFAQISSLSDGEFIYKSDRESRFHVGQVRLGK